MIEEDAGIIYVVDGSEPLLEIHIAEMEILRLTGQPRLAIINRTKAEDHLGEWRRRLGLHFNAVREFNAHYASFSDRVELLETLAGIEQRWKPRLMDAVAIFREEWKKRLDDCADIIFDLLTDALTHYETAPGSELASRRRAVGEKLKGQFMQAVSQREARSHKELILLFEHHRVKPGHAIDRVIDVDLFSEETWRLFGLTERQLVVAGTIGGAGGGRPLRSRHGRALIGLPRSSAPQAEPSGHFSWKKISGIEGELPRSFPKRQETRELGGSTISVGPCRAVNFRWILLIVPSAFFVTSSIAHTPAATKPLWACRNSRPCSKITMQVPLIGATKSERPAKGYSKRFGATSLLLRSATNCATHWERLDELGKAASTEQA